MTDQNEDGHPHFTYFDKPNQLSFIWNGLANEIEVCQGGYGEPVIDRIDIHAEPDKQTAAEWMLWFLAICRNYVYIYSGSKP